MSTSINKSSDKIKSLRITGKASDICIDSGSIHFIISDGPTSVSIVQEYSEAHPVKVKDQFTVEFIKCNVPSNRSMVVLSESVSEKFNTITIYFMPIKEYESTSIYKSVELVIPSDSEIPEVASIWDVATISNLI